MYRATIWELMRVLKPQKVRKMKRSVLFAFMALSAGAFAQVNIAVNGGGYLGDGSLSNPYESVNEGVTFNVDGVNSGGFSVTPFASDPNSFFNYRRMMMKYTAGSNGDPDITYNLPSGNDGSTSVASAGASVMHRTWHGTAFIPDSSGHMFNGSIQNDSLDTASMLIETYDAPAPDASITSGNFVHDYLDNGIYDSDAAVGVIKINKDLHPTLAINVTVPTYEFQRGLVSWDDGSQSPSMFVDTNWNGAWFILDRPGQSGIFTFDDHSLEQTFNIGDSGTHTINGSSGVINVNLASLGYGTYTGSYWGIGWNAPQIDGMDNYASFGEVLNSNQEFNIQIVPEPVTMVSLALAGVLGLKRRKK